LALFSCPAGGLLISLQVFFRHSFFPVNLTGRPGPTRDSDRLAVASARRLPRTLTPPPTRHHRAGNSDHTAAARPGLHRALAGPGPTIQSPKILVRVAGLERNIDEQRVMVFSMSPVLSFRAGPSTVTVAQQHGHPCQLLSSSVSQAQTFVTVSQACHSGHRDLGPPAPAGRLERWSRAPDLGQPRLPRQRPSQPPGPDPIRLCRHSLAQSRPVTQSLDGPRARAAARQDHDPQAGPADKVNHQ
jgi:hypothetical protein